MRLRKALLEVRQEQPSKRIAERHQPPPGPAACLPSCCVARVLHRWDSSKPATVDNLLLLTFEEADAHDATDLQALQQQEPELYRFVDTTLQRVRVEYGC
jgi:hypothetical protein